MKNEECRCLQSSMATQRCQSSYANLTQKDLTRRNTEYTEEDANFPTFLFVLFGNSEENEKLRTTTPCLRVLPVGRAPCLRARN